jgi:glyoxylase-like metal-dependent hydrolase (beta-lactamase superfamily II)
VTQKVQRTAIAVALIIAAASAGGGLHAQGGDAGARAVLERAATALGGLARIQAVRNITLYGYGQYLYQFGGGGVSSTPYSPLKLQAANELQRVYDLQNNRFLQQERRNFLFPFAAPFGHSFALTRLVLDGDVAFDLAENGMARRIGDGGGAGVLQLDGPRMRRMWMLNNPVVAVRTALDPSSTLSRVRVEDGVAVVDVRTRQGDAVSLGFDQTGPPAWVRWTAPHDNLGEVTFTTHLSAYVPYSGVQLPLGYQTRIDWRDYVYFQMTVDGYVLDGQLPDLAAPAAVRTAPEPVPGGPPTIQAQRVADHVWRLSGGTTVFEFDDHLTLYELGGGPAGGQARIDFANTLVPGKRVTELILSHNHFDHITGLRVAIANGLTIIARRPTEGMLRELAARPAPNYPDQLHRNPQPLRFRPVDDRLRLQDRLLTVDVYQVIGTNHLGEGVFAYVPASRVFVEGDIGTAAAEWQFWADGYLDNVEYYKLDPAILSPVHAQVMTHQETLAYIAPGRKRVQQRCEEFRARGDFLPGCPAFLPRGQ